MRNVILSDNKKASWLEYAIAKRAKEHWFFIAKFFDNKRREENTDSKGSIYEHECCLAKVFVIILFIKFGDNVLETIEGGEHDHKRDAKVDNTYILFLFGEFDHEDIDMINLLIMHLSVSNNRCSYNEV